MKKKPTQSPSTPNRSPEAMSKNQTESKPPSVEDPSEEGLDETHCSASSEAAGRALYESDCMKRPHYHDGKPRKKWKKLGKAERWSWCRPAVMLKDGDDMGNLRPNLQYLCDDGTWKESQVKNGEMTKFMVGVYRVILPNETSPSVDAKEK